MRQNAPVFNIQIPPRTLQPCSIAAHQEIKSIASGRMLDVPRSSFEATEILPLLYLGTYSDAAATNDLEVRNITHILNMACECPFVETTWPNGRRLSIKQVKLQDSSDEDIARHFDDALNFIHECRLSGEAVLVHCRLGVSRSATIVLAYLMRYGRMNVLAMRSPQPNCGDQDDDQEAAIGVPMHHAATDTPDSGWCIISEYGMTYEEAFDLVKRLRPQVSPNLGFVLALREFEQAKRSGRCNNGTYHLPRFVSHSEEDFLPFSTTSTGVSPNDLIPEQAA